MNENLGLNQTLKKNICADFRFDILVSYGCRVELEIELAILIFTDEVSL